MSENNYENFRTRLVMNLCSVVRADQMADVLKAVDISLGDFEITRKQMSLITSATLPDVVKIYLASKAVSNRSMKTLAQYRYKLKIFFDAVRKSYVDVTTNDVRMFLYQYKTDHNASDRYMDNIRLTLSGFFAWLVSNDYIRKNPCDLVERIKYQEKERVPLTNYELEVLRWCCRSIREKALVDFLFSTGCRVSECSQVSLADINWDERSVVIRHGKGNKRRIVYFNAESELTLRKYLETRLDDDPALFVRCRAPFCRLSPRSIENEIRKISERSAVEAYPHKLRHTFATSGLRGGISLERLQALLGHADPRTTLIYAKNDQASLQLEHRRVYA